MGSSGGVAKWLLGRARGPAHFTPTGPQERDSIWERGGTSTDSKAAAGSAQRGYRMGLASLVLHMLICIPVGCAVVRRRQQPRSIRMPHVVDTYPSSEAPYAIRVT